MPSQIDLVSQGLFLTVIPVRHFYILTFTIYSGRRKNIEFLRRKQNQSHFGGVYVIFTSLNTLYLSVREKISDFSATWESHFGGVSIIFISSHTPYSVVGEKILDFGAKWGIQFCGSVHHFYLPNFKKWCWANASQPSADWLLQCIGINNHLQKESLSKLRYTISILCPLETLIVQAHCMFLS